MECYFFPPKVIYCMPNFTHSCIHTKQMELTLTRIVCLCSIYVYILDTSKSLVNLVSCWMSEKFQKTGSNQRGRNGCSHSAPLCPDWPNGPGSRRPSALWHPLLIASIDLIPPPFSLITSGFLSITHKLPRSGSCTNYRAFYSLFIMNVFASI